MGSRRDALVPASPPSGRIADTLSVESRSRGVVLIWIGALVLGFALRAVPLTAARPYIAYVDEGNFLHSPFRLLKEGGWNPPVSPYPQLPAVVVAAAARAVDPIHRGRGGIPWRDRIPAHIELYDELEPFGLVFLARSMNVALGIAIVVLTGLLARRLAGPVASAAAASLAAVTPALVLRGSIATVDSFVVVFALACIWLTDRTRTGDRPGLSSFFAGSMAGLAFASKYPSIIVVVAFGVTTLLLPMAGRERLRRLALAAAGLVGTAALAMPALRLNPHDAYASLKQEAIFYGTVVAPPLWRQALLRAEWDIPFNGAELGFVFIAAAAAGIVVCLHRDLRVTLLSWCAYAGIAFALYGTRSFQPFRNLLPLVPLACVAVALLFVQIRGRVRRRVWIGRDSARLDPPGIRPSASRVRTRPPEPEGSAPTGRRLVDVARPVRRRGSLRSRPRHPQPGGQPRACEHPRAVVGRSATRHRLRSPSIPCRWRTDKCRRLAGGTVGAVCCARRLRRTISSRTPTDRAFEDLVARQ